MGLEALLVRLDCSSTSHPQVARFVRQGEDWVLAGVSLQRPGSSFGESGGDRPYRGPREEQSGRFLMTDAYPGCPSCGADAFVRCGRCAETSCWDHTWPMFHCPRCGNSGPVEGEITSMHGTGRD